MYAYIKLSFAIFLKEIIFYFLVQHMSHFLLQTFAFIINDGFEISNERIFSYGNCKVKEEIIQPKCLIFSHDQHRQQAEKQKKLVKN